jgi:cytochrome c oxidase subunit II
MRFILLSLMVLLAGSFASVAENLVNAEIVRGIAKPKQIYYQDAATPVMQQLQGLHDYIFAIITVITIFVTALLGYVCVRFYHKRNPNPSKTTHNILLEIAWITIPALILVTIFIPSFKLHYYMDKTHEADLTLKVTGYQWYWGYSFPEQKVDEYLSNMKEQKDLQTGEPRLLAVDNPLVVPVGKTVRVLLTGADVIHSFAMPAFGVKTDCIPGRLNETWFRAEKTGIYYGQCSELCGQKHGFMPIEIRVVEQDVFDKWVERAKEGNFALDGLNIPQDNKLATK